MECIIYIITCIGMVTSHANAWLVTMDGKSLYTCIPHQNGITACKEALSITENANPEQPPVEILIQPLETVLNNNIFEFSGKVYKQLQGSAMGTRVSPAYTKLFVGKLEEKIWYNYNSPLKPLHYEQFLDDIFMTWPFPEPTIDQLVEQMNRTHPTIRFTLERNPQCIIFLDVSVY